MTIEIEYDIEKDSINIARRGLSLSLAAELFEGSYREKVDDRKNYNEIRIIVTGLIAERLHVCVYTWRNGVRRIISLRKANERETDDYYKS